MEAIVHLIRLLPPTTPRDFEEWVRGVDYATCRKLPSVNRFSVHRVHVDDPAIEPFHYFETIEIRSREEFERDMKTDYFAGLEAEFTQMAEVVGEYAGVRVEPGYEASSDDDSFSG